jgi:hypothetical protein
MGRGPSLRRGETSAPASPGGCEREEMVRRRAPNSSFARAMSPPVATLGRAEKQQSDTAHTASGAAFAYSSLMSARPARCLLGGCCVGRSRVGARKLRSSSRDRRSCSSSSQEQLWLVASTDIERSEAGRFPGYRAPSRRTQADGLPFLYSAQRN